MLIMSLIVPMIIITIHTNGHGVYKLTTWHLYLCGNGNIMVSYLKIIKNLSKMKFQGPIDITNLLTLNQGT
jgi:hypothetical protein